MNNKLTSGQKSYIKKCINEAIGTRLNKLGIEDIEQKSEEIKNLHAKLLKGDNEEDSIDIQIRKMKEKIELEEEELKKFHKEIFGQKNEEGKLEGGLKNELNQKTKQLDALCQNQEKKFETLLKKVEGLLPGATTTGLAKVYQEHKKSFFWPNLFWSEIFIFSIVFIIGVAFWSFDFGNTLSFKDTAIKLLARSPFFLAATWLAVFASKQQSQNKRLEQEYAHKEALSRSFEGYKREIENLGKNKEVKEILEKLANNVVDMTGHNPSETLDKKHDGVKPPLSEEILKKIPPSKKD